MAGNTRSRLALTAVIAVACVAVVASPRGNHQDLTFARVEGRSAVTFHDRVARYVSLHQDFARELADQGVDPSAGYAFKQALADAIRGARPSARPGDLFCDAIAPAIRAAVRAYFASQPPSLWSALLAEMPSPQALRVNDRYPDGEPLVTMPPSLLQRLEPLPDELQYRFYNDALIILDADAALIVDMLRGVVPSET
jgi:hypothetical protein